MHLVNCSVAPAQLLPHWPLLWLLWAATALFWSTGSAAAVLLPPKPKRPLTAWPTVEPIATPLDYLLVWRFLDVCGGKGRMGKGLTRLC